MPKKDKNLPVCLTHCLFGKGRVLSAWTSGSGLPLLHVKFNDRERMVLAEAGYWLSEPEEVARAFETCQVDPTKPVPKLRRTSKKPGSDAVDGPQAQERIEEDNPENGQVVHTDEAPPSENADFDELAGAEPDSEGPSADSVARGSTVTVRIPRSWTDGLDSVA